MDNTRRSNEDSSVNFVWLANSILGMAKTDWKADSKSIVAPGIRQFSVLSEDELDQHIEQLRQKEDTEDNG